MRHEFFPARFHKRFQKRPDSTMVGTQRNADKMSPDPSPIADEATEPVEAIPPLRAIDYIWRPWHAKLWWAAIPIYWGAFAFSPGIPLLKDFFSSGSAGLLCFLFLPMTALIVLGFGYARHWLDRAVWTDNDHDLAGNWQQPGRPNFSVDPFDPRSGSVWIGNNADRDN